MALYHREIGLPKRYFPQGYFRLTYSQHAIESALQDRYGRLNLPNEIFVKDDYIIEVEIQGKDIVKIVYRIPYNNKIDLCLAIAIEKGKRWKCKTVWANEIGDLHSTLRKGVYSVP